MNLSKSVRNESNNSLSTQQEVNMSGITTDYTQQTSGSTWNPGAVKLAIDLTFDQAQETMIVAGRIIAAPIAQLASSEVLEQAKQFATQENCGDIAPLIQASVDIAKGPIGACVAINAPRAVETSIRTVVPLAKEVAYSAVDACDYSVKLIK